jgi:hypothetical protein
MSRMGANLDAMFDEDVNAMKNKIKSKKKI